MSELDITKQVLLFRNFLNDSLYGAIDDLDWEEDGGFVHDWIQANWEFFVERQLFQHKKFISSLFSRALSTQKLVSAK